MSELERIKIIIEKNSAPGAQGIRIVDDVDLDQISKEISGYIDLVRKGLV